MKHLTTALLMGLLALSPLGAADVPRPAGDLAITTPSGDTVDGSTLEGKAVVVMFFSTDCPHCQHTASVMAPIYADYRSKDVEFVGVALNPTANANLGDFIEKYSVEFPVGIGDRELFIQAAGLTEMIRFYYPYLLFINKDGQIREEHEGAERSYFADLNGNLRQSLDRLLDGT
jgi:thiol-disulfide isomerase/thioredoxin